MKTGRPLQDFAAELNRQTNAKRDFVVPSEKMFMGDDGDRFTLSGENDHGGAS